MNETFWGALLVRRDGDLTAQEPINERSLSENDSDYRNVFSPRVLIRFRGNDPLYPSPNILREDDATYWK